MVTGQDLHRFQHHFLFVVVSNSSNHTIITTISPSVRYIYWGISVSTRPHLPQSTETTHPIRRICAQPQSSVLPRSTMLTTPPYLIMFLFHSSPDTPFITPSHIPTNIASFPPLPSPFVPSLFFTSPPRPFVSLGHDKNRLLTLWYGFFFFAEPKVGQTY